MINQIFTAIQPATQGNGVKSDAVQGKPANSGNSNEQGGDPFGAVLAKQLEDKQSIPPAATPSAEAIATGIKVTKSKTDTAIAAPAPDQPPATLAALLFGSGLPPPPATGPTTPSDSSLLSSGGHKTTPLQLSSEIGMSAKKSDAITASVATEEHSTAVQPGVPHILDTGFKTELIKSAETPAPTTLIQTGGTPTPQSIQPDPNAGQIRNTISAPIASPAWPDEFSQKINWVCTQQNQSAELHLNPPDLGPMSVVLTVTDNQASAQFSSPHSAVRDAIENAMPKLRESLAENGIMLGNATVSDQAPRDNGANNFMQQRANTRTDTTELSLNTPAAPVVIRRHQGMLDTFA